MLFFASGRLDLAGIARAFERHDLDIPVLGCTTAGEIGPAGIREDSICALGLPAGGFLVDLVTFDDLDRFAPAEAGSRVRETLARQAARAIRLWGEQHQAGVLLVDGLSLREELIAAAIAEALGTVPLVGGSAGDGLDFREAYIFLAGSFRRNAAALLLITSARPMHAFSRKAVRVAGPRVVVTAADPDRRIVHELNAVPAAREYAQMVGVAPEALQTDVFALHPLLVKAGGDYHVRSIQRVTKDEGLAFYCGIDNGLVLTLGEDSDQETELLSLFAELERELGAVDRILAFNCVHNSAVSRIRQQEQSLSRLFAGRRVIGFSSFGEQFGALHLNQTFTGLAFGAPGARRRRVNGQAAPAGNGAVPSAGHEPSAHAGRGLSGFRDGRA